MTSIIAKHHDVRHSPFKMRVVANQVKSLPLSEAESTLELSRKKAARYILKVLRSAIANAENNFGLQRKDLVIGDMQIGGGRIYRKSIYRARGRMDVGRSQFSNVRIVLESTSVEPEEKDSEEKNTKKEGGGKK